MRTNNKRKLEYTVVSTLTNYIVPETMDGIFFKTPPTLWKFQNKLPKFLKFFGIIEPPTPHPQEIPIPSMGGVWIFLEQLILRTIIAIIGKNIVNKHYM